MLPRFLAVRVGLTRVVVVGLMFCLIAADPPPAKATELLFTSEAMFPPLDRGPVDFAVDAAGSVYVTGSVSELWRADWEEAGGDSAKLQAGPGTVALPCGPFAPWYRDIYVGKLSANGREWIYLKFFGGSRDEEAAAIAVDRAGGVVVTGFTESRDFPGVEGGASKNIGRDVFVMELSPDGSQIVRTTLLGGDDRDEPHDIAIDAANAIYVAGETVSPDFPARNSLPRGVAHGGMLRSDDAAETWVPSNDGLVERRIRAIVPDPYRDSVVYLVTNAGLFRSTDAGANWQAVGETLVPEVVLSVAIDPEEAATLYAGTENGVFKTVDGGASWFSISGNLPEPSRVTHVAVDPSDPEVIYLGTAGGPFKSNDGGQSWSRLRDAEIETTMLALDPGNPSTVYVSQYYFHSCGFFAFPATLTLEMSSDGGATFESILNNLEGENQFVKPRIVGLAVNPLDAMNLFVATTQGVFRTTDGGAHWLTSNEGLPGGETAEVAGPGVEAVVIDPLNPSRLYALMASYPPAPQEAFASDDAGLSWQRIDFGAEFGAEAGRISALAVDPMNSSRVYAGTSEERDADGFVVKLAPQSRLLEYSTIVGGSGVDVALLVAASESGHAYVGGSTQSDDFPVVAALQAGRAGEDEIFVTKLAADGSSLDYSTYLGGSLPDRLHGLSLDRDGSVVLAGQTFSPDFPTAHGLRSRLSGPSDAFVTRLSADGSSVIYSGLLGGAGEDRAVGVAVASGGEVYVTGLTGSANFPVTDLGAGCNRFYSTGEVPFLTKLDAAGSRIERSTRMADAWREHAVVFGIVADAADDAFLLLNGQTVFTRGRNDIENPFWRLHIAKFDLSGKAPALTAPCMVNAASLIPGPIAPGEIVTIYGNGMGPEEFLVAQPGDAGRLPLELDGTRVLFDGEPGPIVHVQSNQVSAVAPRSVVGKSSLIMEVERGGERSAAVRWLASEAHPGIFTEDYSSFGPAVYNEDWTVNSSEDSAHPGGVVTVFLNGGGLTDPPVDPAGYAALDAPLAHLKLPVTASLDGIAGTVEYAGTVPGAQHGVMQVNVRIPADLRRQTNARDFRMVIGVDGLLSQAVSLWVD